MEALNHYFHDQKSGEYWRPFGHKKSPRNIRQNDKTVVGNKHRHTGLEIRIFCPKTKGHCSIISFATFFALEQYNIYIYTYIHCIYIYTISI